MQIYIVEKGNIYEGIYEQDFFVDRNKAIEEHERQVSNIDAKEDVVFENTEDYLYATFGHGRQDYYTMYGVDTKD